MELFLGGSLQKYIDNKTKSNQKITDSEASKIMGGIFDAVTYIHENGTIHRDLKTENILFEDSDDLSSIKIIDFGFGDKKNFS